MQERRARSRVECQYQDLVSGGGDKKSLEQPLIERTSLAGGSMRIVLSLFGVG